MQSCTQDTVAKYGWLTVGYGYSQSVDGSWTSTYPVKFTICGLLWKYVGSVENGYKRSFISIYSR